MGKHEGGFDPFSFNITPYLTKSGNQNLTVEVWDPTDEGPQPRGKQVKRPEGIWYTPVTGIWQTVWVEAVNKAHIDHIKITPDIDQKTIAVSSFVENAAAGDQVKISAWDGSNKVAEQTTDAKGTVSLKIENPKLWSPASPFYTT